MELTAGIGQQVAVGLYKYLALVSRSSTRRYASRAAASRRCRQRLLLHLGRRHRRVHLQRHMGDSRRVRRQRGEGWRHGRRQGKRTHDSKLAENAARELTLSASASQSTALACQSLAAGAVSWFQ